jgi:hypothetical protein
MFGNILLLAFGLIAAPSPEAPRPPPPHPLAEFIASRAPRWWTHERREEFGRKLSERIFVEARRRDLSPAALAAVAWIESDFSPYAVNKRDGSVGVWQLIPYDSPVEAAARSLAGCRSPPRLPPYLRPLWARRGFGAPCEDQGIADLRLHVGAVRPRELADLVLSTYIAAFEIRMHRDSAERLRRRPPPVSACSSVPASVQLMATYNSGPRPMRPAYLWKLCVRYGLLSKLLPPPVR